MYWIKYIFKISCVTIVVISGMGNSFAQLVSVPLSQRVDNAQVIIEGKVISSTSFWDAPHYNIYTSNIVEVYKVFKGTLTVTEVEIITEGGTVGNQRQTVTHTLELKQGDVGIWTFKSNSIKKLDKSINPGYVSFRPYADKQGFLRYNLVDNTAKDVFKDYGDIKTIVYPAVTTLTKREYTNVKTVDFYKNSSDK